MYCNQENGFHPVATAHLDFQNAHSRCPPAPYDGCVGCYYGCAAVSVQSDRVDYFTTEGSPRAPLQLVGGLMGVATICFIMRYKAHSGNHTGGFAYT